MSEQSELTRLCNHAIGIELSGKACAFIDMSGHVDWLSISLRESKEKYDIVLGNWQVNYDTDYDGKKIPEKTIKNNIDRIIKEMDDTVTNLDSAIEKSNLAKKELELKQLAELKKKYETNL